MRLNHPYDVMTGHPLGLETWQRDDHDARPGASPAMEEVDEPSAAG